MSAIGHLLPAEVERIVQDSPISQDRIGTHFDLERTFYLMLNRILQLVVCLCGLVSCGGCWTYIATVTAINDGVETCKAKTMNGHIELQGEIVGPRGELLRDVTILVEEKKADRVNSWGGDYGL